MLAAMAGSRSSSIIAEDRRSPASSLHWTDYKKAGPLLFSLDHQSKADDAPVHIFFSNVAVKLMGSENWINAQ